MVDELLNETPREEMRGAHCHYVVAKTSHGKQLGTKALVTCVDMSSFLNQS